MKRVKNFGVILVLNKSEERSEKRVVFVHNAVFERARNCEKIVYKRAKFFCSHAASKSSFQLLMVMRFDYDILLVLGWF